MADKPHVVIIGGGFGGLYAAQALNRAPVRITLIDKSNHHLFQPLLYQVATAGLSPGDIAEPIRTILRHQRNVHVLMAEVIDIDVDARQVHLADDDPIGYDHLILATGATHTYFGNDQWSDLAPGLKSLENAVSIRKQFLTAFEEAERTKDKALRRKLLTFVIIGGGPTGVELAGTMAEMARQALPRDFDNIAPDDARVILLEGSPRVLKVYPEELSAKAQKALEDRGVEVRTKSRVTEIDNDGVFIKEERVEAANVFWAAGVQGNPLGRCLGAPTTKRGLVKVNPDLTIPDHPEVFVVGDLAQLTDAEGKYVPGVAQGAIQMGQYAARVIRSRVAGKAAPKPFVYKDKGSMATIGRAAAVAMVGKRQFSGWFAWLMWLAVHLLFLIGFDNRLIVLIQWTWYYFSYKQGTRLITASYKGHENPRLNPAMAAYEVGSAEQETEATV